MANGFRGAIFDVDGVLVDSPHEKAWREGLRQLMENDWSDIRDQTSWAPDAFTPQVYQREMSGKPRYKGAQAALEYFGVPDAQRRAQEYGDRKQEMIVELIEAADFEEYPDALRFVLALKEAGVLIAAASSSKNAGAFLRLVRLDEFAEREGLSYDFLTPGFTLLDILDGDVSGRDFEHGKPHPMIFWPPPRRSGCRRRKLSLSRTPPTASRRRRPASSRPWASRARTTRTRWRRRARTWW
jgi:beta-phosphoglucomutase-like phosphatase (HAD superfamily)